MSTTTSQDMGYLSPCTFGLVLDGTWCNGIGTVLTGSDPEKLGIKHIQKINSKAKNETCHLNSFGLQICVM